MVEFKPPLTRAILIGLAIGLGGWAAARPGSEWQKAPLISTFPDAQPFLYRPLIGDTASAAKMRFVDGEMQINLARHEPLVAYRGIKSTFYTNFVDKSWSVKTDFDALHMQHGIEAKFHVTLDHDRDFLSIQYEETGLRLVQRAGDRFWEQVVPYRAQEDRWWRIRHDGSDDTIWWEVSADGKAWKALAHRPRLFDLHKVRVELYAGTFAPVANPGVVGYLELQERRSGQDS